MRREPQRLVILDETGTTTNMTRLRGRAPLGARLRMQAPFGHWRTQNLHRRAEMRRPHRAPWTLDGPMSRRAFEADLETQLAPTLQAGHVVVPGQSVLSQRTAGRGNPPRSRRLALVPAALLPRSTRSRTPSPSSRSSCERRAGRSTRCAAPWRDLRAPHAERMLELLPSRRIRRRSQLNVRALDPLMRPT